MLQSLIGNLDNLGSKEVEQLVDLQDKYPYCQSVQLLYSIALANIHSTKLNMQVQRAAISMPDRLKLCQLVSKGEFEWIEVLNEIEQKKKKEETDVLSDDFMLIEKYLDNIGETSDILPYDISSVSISDYELEDLDEADMLVGDEQDALIDSFIEAEQNGELFVPKAQNLLDLDNAEDDAVSLKKIREKAFLSESLAKIYVKQHKYERALAIFSSLNLKYSKKYTYFADQIRYLETILKYQNGEE